MRGDTDQKNSEWRRSGVFIVNSDHIRHLGVSVVSFEQVIAGWVILQVAK